MIPATYSGMIIGWPKNKAVPFGWLACDHRLYERSVSEELFSIFGENCKEPGDPENFFRTPNDRALLPPNAVARMIVKL